MHWAYTLLIFISVLAVVGISIWLFLLHYRDRNVGGNSRPECTDEKLNSMLLSRKYLDNLHHLIASTTAALKSANMTNWIDSGTLLSCVRHNGKLIPWDDDADVAVIDSDWHNKTKQAAFREHLSRFGLTISKFGSLWQLRLKDVAESPHLDIFLYKQKEKTISLANGFAQFMNRSNVFPIGEIFPLQKRTLLNSSGQELTVNVPNQASAVLGRVYGSQKNRNSWQNEMIAVQHKQISTLLKPCTLTIEQKNRIFSEKNYY